jgi:hypothetical protein
VTVPVVGFVDVIVAVIKKDCGNGTLAFAVDKLMEVCTGDEPPLGVPPPMG